MAQKRMFSLSVVDTDKFLEMPISSRLLYYELGMRADDDGFVDNWKKILLFTGLKEDDMKVLITKQFIIPFESGVIVIRHWRMNNYLQNDRTKPTIYQKELQSLEINNGEYNIISDNYIEEHSHYLELNWKDKREQAYKESELPYSFDYKIRKAFQDKKCPICNYEMKDYVNAPHRPTIQHNIPISKGGKHELGNISVICHKCNVSLRDKITDELNSKEVIEEWDKINSCIQGCIHRIDKNSIDKNSIEKEIYKEKEKYGEFKNVLLTEEEYHKLEESNLLPYIEKLSSYIASKGKKYKSHYATILTWHRGETKNEKPLPEWFDKEFKEEKDLKATEEMKDILKEYK